MWSVCAEGLLWLQPVKQAAFRLSMGFTSKRKTTIYQACLFSLSLEETPIVALTEMRRISGGEIWGKDVENLFGAEVELRRTSSIPFD